MQIKKYNTEEYAFDNKKKIFDTKCFSEFIFKSVKFEMHKRLNLLEDYFTAYDGFTEVNVFSNYEISNTKCFSEIKNNENFIENDKIKSVHKYDSLYYLYYSDEENRYNSSTETDYRDLINNESYIDTTPDKKEVMIEDNDEKLNNASTAITNNITS